MEINDIIKYVMKTPWNTNPAILKRMINAFCVTGEVGDCEHTDLGTLYYCGGLQSGNIINLDGTYDEGAVVTDADEWVHKIRMIPTDAVGHMVSDGVNIVAAPHNDSAVDFGETTLEIVTDDETGDPYITISNAPSHYAIYFKEP